MANDDACELLCLDLGKAEALRHAVPSAEALDGAARAAKGLAEPTRLAIALALRDGGELCVCDLGWVTSKSEKLVSHHVRLMRAAGVLRSRKEGRMVLYELTDSGCAVLAALAPIVGEAVT